MSALQSLLLAAQVAGVSPAPLFESGVAANVPQQILSLPLAEIREAQSSASVVREVDGVRLTFSAASGPETLWLRVFGAGVTRQWSWKALGAGVSGSFGGKTIRFSADAQGLVTAGSLTFSFLDELWRLYDRAVRIRIDPVLYAVTYENGSAGIPPSVSLIRKDSEGMGWITYRSVDRLAGIHYFVAVNGVLFGMRLEGQSLVFYRKPIDGAVLAIEERPFFL
ncbi:MAG: hypothetical protein COB53_06980 [Elusimicrobia bacterium]|nr:MAG: hypothetical protein COB53_06980 [Elusimicrobiota bacterium]